MYCSTFLYVSQCFPPSQAHYSWWVVLSIKLVTMLNVAGKFHVHDQLYLLFPSYSCCWIHSVALGCFSLPKSTSCECVTWKEHDVKTVIRNKKRVWDLPFLTVDIYWSSTKVCYNHTDF
jgi:hypothetical protein